MCMCCQQLPQSPLPECGRPCVLTLIHPEAVELMQLVSPMLLSLAVKSPVILVLEIETLWLCNASSSVATDELANHGHGISISTTSLVGDTYTWRPAEYEDVKASGVLSCSKYGEHCAGDGGKQGNGHIHIDVSHGHSASISATGGNARHENRPPFTVVNRWKRTA